MVTGLDIFKKHFEQYTDNYVIIGGTACDIIINEAGFKPRTTKDIDIILIIEALSEEFVKQFWSFVIEGKYEIKEKSDSDRQYYRFMKPGNKEFPYQIELFARSIGLINFDKKAHLTPIPMDGDLSSLSAILLNDDYYHYMINQSVLEDGIHLANKEAIICLKAKAYLEIADRIANGGNEDKKQLRKHKADIFRLAVTLKANDIYELPVPIMKHMDEFYEAISNDLPDKVIFKEMGLSNIESITVFDQLKNSFPINSSIYDISTEVERLKKKQESPKIKKSKHLIKKALKDVYFPLLSELNLNLLKLNPLFKDHSWLYFQEPSPPEYGIPMLPRQIEFNDMIKYFNQISVKEENSYHDYKATYWFSKYNDKNSFSLEISLKIYFRDTNFQIEIFIGQQFAGGMLGKAINKLVKSFDIDEETRLNPFKDYIILEEDYNSIITKESIPKMAEQISQEALSYIKQLTNNEQ